MEGFVIHVEQCLIATDVGRESTENSLFERNQPKVQSDFEF